jgi:hypothetical protein
MKRALRLGWLPLLVAAALSAHADPIPTPTEPIARAVQMPDALVWDSKVAYRSVRLRVVGPEGLVHEESFGSGPAILDLAALPKVPDGQYAFELAYGRNPDAAQASALAGVDRAQDEHAGLRALPGTLGETLSGSFRVVGGKIVSRELVEPRSSRKATRDPGPKDVVTPDDAIIQGSLCVGLDCVDGESFGFSTIRLKENNTRIEFLDTSVSTFPSNDWMLEANDSASGGANRFSIVDLTGAKTPFTVTAGAPTGSIHVNSAGNVGFGTTTPVLKLHELRSDTPAIRLEQDASGGFTAQTWDIAGNEANFFVRDLTGGSTLPLRIRPGAPTSSLDISAAGHVGIGTASPNVGGAARAVTITAPASAGFSALELQGSQDANTAAGVVRFYNKTNLVGQIAAARESADSSASLRFLTANSGVISEKMRILPSGFVGIGTMSPSTLLHVAGDATITGALHVSGPCCGPDYVFEPGFRLASIEENDAYMWKHRHLPSVGPARTTADGQAVVDVFAQSKGMLEELEKAHIYIGQLHREIAALKSQAEARDAQLRSELAELRRAIGK